MLTPLDIKSLLEELGETNQLMFVEHMIDNKIPFSENSNGIFINLTELTSEQMNIIEIFIANRKKADELFARDEILKEEYKKQLKSNTNDEEELVIPSC